MGFGYDGAYQEVAFSNFDGDGFFAAMSTNLENECHFNFGAAPFVYSFPGYQPLAECITNKQCLWK